MSQYSLLRASKPPCEVQAQSFKSQWTLQKYWQINWFTLSTLFQRWRHCTSVRVSPNKFATFKSHNNHTQKNTSSTRFAFFQLFAPWSSTMSFKLLSSSIDHLPPTEARRWARGRTTLKMSTELVFFNISILLWISKFACVIVVNQTNQTPKEHELLVLSNQLPPPKLPTHKHQLQPRLWDETINFTKIITLITIRKAVFPFQM